PAAPREDQVSRFRAARRVADAIGCRRVSRPTGASGSSSAADSANTLPWAESVSDDPSAATQLVCVVDVSGGFLALAAEGRLLVIGSDHPGRTTGVVRPWAGRT